MSDQRLAGSSRKRCSFSTPPMKPFRHKSRIIAVVLIIVLYSVYSSFSRRASHTEAAKGSKKQLLQRALKRDDKYRENGLNFHTTERVWLPLRSRLQNQLSKEFVYRPEAGFPKNIWQTWKVGLDHETFPSEYRGLQATWDEENPGYKHFVIADDQCDSMVHELFAQVPDVVDAWSSMPKSILKADFFRYLILYARGGVYSDIDTMAIQPVDKWASLSSSAYGTPNNAGFVVGIEADPDRPDWADWYARRIQFCQWTIQAKKGHPVLRDLIAKITEITLKRKRDGTLAEVLGNNEGGDIMNWTGPGIFTDMVFEYMNGIMQTRDVLEKGTPKDYDDIITWELFTNMRVPIVLEDVMVLPITCFSPDVGQMGAGSISDSWAYVYHLFLGSWKHADTHKPRERHH